MRSIAKEFMEPNRLLLAHKAANDELGVDSDKAKPYMYVVGSGTGYARPWLPLFQLTRDRKQADVALFTGGSDIGPELYGDQNVKSWPFPTRDAEEVPFYREFRKRGVPILGICRGAQLACAMEGGKLYQHVERHANGGHGIHTHDGKEFFVTSLHHQMMRPTGLHELHGWTERRSPVYVSADADGNPIETIRAEVTGVDPEVVWWPKGLVYGIQGHPEMMQPDEPGNIWFRSEVKRLIIDRK